MALVKKVSKKLAKISRMFVSSESVQITATISTSISLVVST